ncbi:nucleotidyltransferase [Metamycoplasma canadense]|nr:nucleotidyltransferase [Metamycoplasma canadense]
MLKIGLIAEFNPFHNGHIFLLNKIKEKYPNSKIIVALSSNYTQRGEIALVPFTKRKKICKKFGVNKVIKLDFETSTQAAHIFAKGSIEKLKKLKIDLLFFGTTDTDDINKYINATKTISKNIDLYNQKVKYFLKQGRSFIYSCYEALKDFISEENIPQDILGFEYTKYIINNNLNIKLDCIKRSIAHSNTETNGVYASGTKLRSMIKENKDISLFSPLKIKKFKKIENTYLKFKKIVKKMSTTKLSKIALMSEGMENLFKKNIEAKSYDEFIQLCTSKRYTSSRIKRVYLYVLKKKYKK